MSEYKKGDKVVRRGAGTVIDVDERKRMGYDMFLVQFGYGTYWTKGADLECISTSRIENLKKAIHALYDPLDNLQIIADIEGNELPPATSAIRSAYEECLRFINVCFPDQKATNKATQLHNEAMDLAGQITVLSRDAACKESEAARLIDVSQQPTHSVLHRSAATLCAQANMLSTAEEHIKEGLEGEPPGEIAEELEEVRELVEFYRRMK